VVTVREVDMTDARLEYENAKRAYLKAQERLTKAKAAVAKLSCYGPSKADLAREAAIARDERIASSYAGGITSTKQLAALHSVSPATVAQALTHIKNPEYAAEIHQWRAVTLARIRGARGE
jgi:hypothetical protein